MRNERAFYCPDFVYNSIDAKVFCFFNTNLSKINLIPSAQMQVLSVVFRVYERGNNQIWSYKRRLARDKTHNEMPPA